MKCNCSCKNRKYTEYDAVYKQVDDNTTQPVHPNPSMMVSTDFSDHMFTRLTSNTTIRKTLMNDTNSHLPEAVILVESRSPPRQTISTLWQSCK